MADASAAARHLLLSPTEMARADALAIADGTPGLELMRNAGYAVADLVCRRVPQGSRVSVLCGMGNNGGDGFVAAEVLRLRGYIVTALIALPEGRSRVDIRGDAARALAGYRGSLIDAEPRALQKAKVIVDALYGAGLSRDIAGRDAGLIEAVNAARAGGAIVVAVDLPSGIDGATGAVRGCAVGADETVTFFRRKPGHLLMPGRAHAGRVTLADIGIRDDVLTDIGAQCFVNAPDLWRDHWPVPDLDGHKYSRGAALVLSGPAQSSGAARLAAEAALRAGAGIVTVATPRDAVPVVASHRAAFVVKPVDTSADVDVLIRERRLRAAVIGPGAGLDADVRHILTSALSEDGPALVLDADALTLMAQDPASRFAAIAARTAPVVLTPHEGEFARLFPDLDGSKLSRARAAAARSGAVVVLKGPDSVIAAPDGRAAINDNAPATLATAGSGDVLAGIIAGMLAAGCPPWEAAAMGVHIHGRAGVIAGPGAIADDIATSLRSVMAEGCPPPDDTAEDGGPADGRD